MITEGIRMGPNLGFIEKVILTDGTVLENIQVLYNAPVPGLDECERIIKSANGVSRKILGKADRNWSAHPERMINSPVLK